MKIIGLTGGIGSGKTTVSDLFEELGVPVIDADVIARQVVEPGQAALTEIQQQFSGEVINDDGRLNRDALRQIVFEQPEKRRTLETILHPAIAQEMLHQASKLNTHYCLFVIPLIIEAQQQHLVDRILVVDAPDQLRRQRVKQRSQLDDQQIDAIFAAQVNRDTRLRQADDIIYNSSDLDDLRTQVLHLHNRYNEI